MQRRAVFDATRRYRYALTRRWKPGGTRVAFILLNPSRADNHVDDPTLRRCIAFARRWGHHALHVVNLYGLRTPDPRLLFQAADPVGPQNDRHLGRAAAVADCVVCGWGVHGLRQHRGVQIATRLQRRGRRLHALGFTAGGAPRHPLFTRSNSELQPYTPRCAQAPDQ